MCVPQYTWASSPVIILFSERLKFSKENKEFDRVFGYTSFVEIESSKI
jgi:hypothetical protein